MPEVFHPCSLCNAHASFYKDPEQSIREAVALEIEALLCGDTCCCCDSTREIITIVRNKMTHNHDFIKDFDGQVTCSICGAMDDEKELA